MIATWYSIVSFMLIVYIVLDGRNFGAGMLHWLVAKTPEERRQVVAAIGPLWPWLEFSHHWDAGHRRRDNLSGNASLDRVARILAAGRTGRLECEHS